DALPEGYSLHEMRPDLWEDPMLQPLRVALNPAHGACLLRLPAELVWATSWAHDANTWISPHLGLPDLPVVEWPADFNAFAPIDLCWKTPTLLDYAAGRPFAFVDDDVTDADRRWAAERCQAPMLFHRVDPAKGLVDEDFAILDAWLRDLSSS